MLSPKMLTFITFAATVGAYHTADVPYWLGTLDSLNLFRPTRDWTAEDRALSSQMMAHLLAAMKSPAFPTAIGVLYCDPASTYEMAVHEQLASEKEKKPNTDLNALLRQGSTWTVD